jgi:hypothetical protein
MRPRQFRRQHKIEQDKALSATVRKYLSADALIRSNMPEDSQEYRRNGMIV